jgi:hypothetical protein
VNKRTITLATLIVAIALLLAAVPAFGAPPEEARVSGLECVYLDTPAMPELISDYVVFIKGQVNVNRFYSDDPATFPNGTNTAVLDIRVNLRTGMVVWSSDAVFQPDGVNGNFEGIGRGWIKTDPVTGEFLDSKGLGVFHGTGELEGLTLKQDLLAGDMGQCPQAENLFDASLWSGFIVPPAP